MSQPEKSNRQMTGSESPHFQLADPAEPVSAWEEVEAGRFMPKRVRGSYQGRALG